MKTVILALLALTLSPQSRAAEIEIEAVNSTTTLQLLGRGIAARHSEDSLAVACYRSAKGYPFNVADEACPAIRFVWFKNAREAYYVGPVLATPGTPDPKLKRKAIQLVIREFFNTHQTEASERGMRAHARNTFLAIGGVTSGIALNLPMTATGAVIGSTGLALSPLFAMVGLYFILSNVDVMDHMVSGTLIDAKMTDDQGWSWSGRPKRISKNKFKVALGQVVKGNRLNVNHYSKNAKIGRIARRLYDKGVDFPQPIASW